MEPVSSSRRRDSLSFASPTSRSSNATTAPAEYASDLIRMDQERLHLRDLLTAAPARTWGSGRCRSTSFTLAQQPARQIAAKPVLRQASGQRSCAPRDKRNRDRTPTTPCAHLDSGCPLFDRPSAATASSRSSLPSGCAEERSAAGRMPAGATGMLRDLTCRSCPSRVNAVNVASSAAGRCASTEVAAAHMRDADIGVAFPWLLSLAKQRKRLARRGEFPAPDLEIKRNAQTSAREALSPCPERANTSPRSRASHRPRSLPASAPASSTPPWCSGSQRSSSARPRRVP